MSNGRRKRRLPDSCVLCGFAVCLTLFSASAKAITIRDDVPDAAYISLSADPLYESELALYFFLNADPNTNNWCTGTLVHPEWFITAAHCTKPTATWTSIAYRGADRNNPDDTIAIDVDNRNAAFNGNAALGNDFGLLHLVTPILDVTPARMYRDTAELGKTATVLGYGLTGTGLTGQTTSLTNGIRRAMQNSADAFGNTFGWSPKILVTDFDDPTGSSNVIGSATPLGLEGNVALNDSGGGWFQQIAGIHYLTAVTSFRASNSEYGDVSGGGRVSQDMVTWIDDNYDRTLFWNSPTGTWDQATSWDGEIEPTAVSAAIIDDGTVTVASAGATAEYVFVQDAGTLSLNNALQTSYLRIRSLGELQLGSPAGTASITGQLVQEGGTIVMDIAGASPGFFDTLNVGGTATLDGMTEIETETSYGGPATRGATNSFTLISAANMQGDPIVSYDGDAIAEMPTYVGLTNSGLDGLFASYEMTGTELQLDTYLALPGDANGDAVVDVSDFEIWNQNKFTLGTDWSTGDFNNDGLTDGADFNIWNENKFTVAAVRPVPEPTIACGTSLLLAMALRRHCRQRGCITRT